MRRTWVLLQSAEQSGAPNCLLLPYLLCLPQILTLSLLSPLQNHSVMVGLRISYLAACTYDSPSRRQAKQKHSYLRRMW